MSQVANYGTCTPFECRAREVSIDVRWRNCRRKMGIVVVGCAEWYSTVLSTGSIFHVQSTMNQQVFLRSVQLYCTPVALILDLVRGSRSIIHTRIRVSPPIPVIVSTRLRNFLSLVLRVGHVLGILLLYTPGEQVVLPVQL